MRSTSPAGSPLAAGRGSSSWLRSSSSESCRSTRISMPSAPQLESGSTTAAAVAARMASRCADEIVRTRAGHARATTSPRVAAEHRAELVVVGAPVKSRRGFRRPFPAEILPLLRAAPCRVLIATGPVAGRGAAAGRAAFTKILVPMKLGAIGEEMVATAVKLAQERGAAVEALHVIRVPLDQPLDAELVRAGGAARPRRSPRPPRSAPTTASRSRAARSAPARSARRSSRRPRRAGADLIVLGSSPRWRRQSRFFSPTVDYVLRKAPAEVLVVAFPQGVLEEV